MFLPLRQENSQGRRWPVISIALVLLNLLVFLATHWKMQEDNPQRGEVRAHILLLAASHADINVPDRVREVVDTFKRQHPDTWSQAQASNRSDWKSNIRNGMENSKKALVPVPA